MSEDQSIFKPTEEDQATLEKQRGVIGRCLAGNKIWESYGTPSGKLGVLCAILEARVFSPDQTYELQCMGIVFGDTFVQDMEFAWVMVEDSYGRDPAIKYKDTSIILYPLTMISKRLEKGEEVDVFDLYNGIAETVKKMVLDGY